MRPGYLYELEKLSKADLEPGDIVLTSLSPLDVGSRRGAGLGFRAMRSAYRSMSPRLQGTFSHSALYVGDGQVVEALGHGVVTRSLATATRGKAYVALRPDVAESTRMKAVSFAKKQVGKPYDPAGAVGAGIGLFFPQKVSEGLLRAALRSPEDPSTQTAFQCASLIRAAYAKAGVRGGPSWRTTAPIQFLLDEKARVVRHSLKGSDLGGAGWSSKAEEIRAAHGRLRGGVGGR